MADIVLESPFGPEWLAGDKINELEFCKAFLEQHPMNCPSLFEQYKKAPT